MCFGGVGELMSLSWLWETPGGMVHGIGVLLASKTREQKEKGGFNSG